MSVCAISADAAQAETPAQKITAQTSSSLQLCALSAHSYIEHTLLFSTHTVCFLKRICAQMHALEKMDSAYAVGGRRATDVSLTHELHSPI